MLGGRDNASTSQLQRKLARQRELERMEAEASGIAPSMELDVSSLFGSNTTPATSTTSTAALRSRNSSASSSHSLQQPLTGEIARPTTRATSSIIPAPASSSQGFFERRDAPPQHSLNLMDHETGVYHDPPKRRSSFLGWFGSRSDPHDAVGVEPDYIGDVSRYPRKTTARVSPLQSQLRTIFCASRRRALFWIALAAVFCALLATWLAMSTIHRRKENALRKAHDQRFNDVLDQVIGTGVSHMDTIADYSSPEYHALRWVSYSDPAHVDPTDPMVLQRYALAVFYYGSYLTFTKTAGKQAPIQLDDNAYWEGVPNPGWKRKDYWMTSTGHCMWYGVYCAPRPDDRGVTIYRYDDAASVIHLNLTSNNIQGTIPPEFRAFDQLKSLDLSNNKLHGSFPSRMGFMFRIEKLFLDRNMLSGSLPKEFGNLEGVGYVRLSNNKLKGSIPTELNRLWNVYSLALDHNFLTGSVPDLSGCLKLTSLYLDHNSLSGVFPFSVSKLRGLYDLYLNDNRFTGTITPELESIDSLRTLHIENNRIGGEIPNHMFTFLSHLREVAMQNNSLTGDLPPDVSSARHLQILTLNTNKLKGTIPKTWSGFTSLETLHLYENQLFGPIPDCLGSMANLKELWLHSNALTSYIPTSLGQATKLETLFIEHNQLIGILNPALSSLQQLETLRVFDNKLHGKINEAICSLKNFSAGNHLTYLAADCMSAISCQCCDKCY